MRFEFGKNWKRYSFELNEARISRAQDSLKEMLGLPDLRGKTFLDIGSGSGLFSLAAKRLGATVYSFDYDPKSVACTQELKQRYFPDDPAWIIEKGSVLDKEYLKMLGQFDIVYSWGVLHHTGAMWQALENVSIPTKRGGVLFIAIYNDQGRTSRYWVMIKRTYNKLPRILRFIVLYPVFMRLWCPTMLRDIFKGKPFSTWLTYQKERGMSPCCDVIDWVGGYPFEVAKPEEIFDFYRDKGFVLDKLKTCASGHGCNEYVFRKSDE